MSRTELTPPHRPPSLLGDLPPSSLLLLGVAIAGVVASGLFLQLRGPILPATPPVPTPPPSAPEVLWECPAPSAPAPAAHEIALACAELEVDAVGSVAFVRSRHRFEAGAMAPTEATYVMPLPHDAAIHAYRMCTPLGCVNGDLQEDADARRTYEQAVANGQTATLLDQRRDDTFSLALGNLPRNGAIVIELAWYQPLEQRDDHDELTIPMQDRPRFEGELTASHARDEALPTDTTASHTLRVPVHVTVDTGGPIRDVSAPNHEASTTFQGVRTAELDLVAALPGDTVVVRIARPSAHATALSWFVDTDEGSFMAFDLGTPSPEQTHARVPIDWELVLDTSGSMSGPAIEQLRALTAALAERAHPTDRMSITTFGSRVQTHATMDPVATQRARLTATLRGLYSGGGTYMTDGLLRAVRAPSEEGRQRVIVLVTDGAIGSHTSVLNAADAGETLAPIVAIGVGPSVHRDVLDDLAEWTGGYDDIVSDTGDVQRIVDQLLAAGTHSLRKLHVDIGGGEIEWATPLPAFVWPGARTTVIGRITGTLPEQIELTALAGNAPHRVQVSTTTTTTAPEAVRLWWASQRIDHLERRYHRASGDEVSTFRDAIVGVSLREGLASSFTSFVAVADASLRSNVGDALEEAPAAAPADRTTGMFAGEWDNFALGVTGVERGGGRVGTHTLSGFGAGLAAPGRGAGAAPSLAPPPTSRAIAQASTEGRARTLPFHAAVAAEDTEAEETTAVDEPAEAEPAPARDGMLQEQGGEETSLQLALHDVRANGGIATDAVQRVLRRRLPRVRACYEAAAHVALPLRFEVVFDIDATGRVTAAVARDVADNDLATCLERETRQLRFDPGATGSATATYRMESR